MVNVQRHGASGSRRQYTVNTRGGSPNVSLTSNHDFHGDSRPSQPSGDGHGILIYHAGPDKALPAPSQVSALRLPLALPNDVTGYDWTSTYSYSIVALTPNGGYSAASSKTSISMCPSTLDAGVYVTLSWNPTAGASAYAIYDSSDNLIALVSGMETTWHDKGAQPRDNNSVMPDRPRTLQWMPNQTYNVGEWVLPRSPNGHAYQCIAARADRLSSASDDEPTWPVNVGEEVEDNHVIWAESMLTVPLTAPTTSGRDWLRTQVREGLTSELVLTDSPAVSANLRAIHDDFDALKRVFDMSERSVYVPKGDYNIVVGGVDDSRFEFDEGPESSPRRLALIEAEDISFEWEMHPAANIRIMNGMIPVSKDKTNSELYVFHFNNSDRITFSGGAWQWLPNGGVLYESSDSYNGMHFCWESGADGNEDHLFDRVTWDGLTRWGYIIGPAHASRGHTRKSRKVFRDCKVLNFGGGGHDAFAYFRGGSYWFDRCFIQSNRSFSSHFLYTSPHDGPDFRITNCEFNQCGKNVICLYASDSTSHIFPPNKNLLISGCSFRKAQKKTIIVMPAKNNFTTGIWIENCSFEDSAAISINNTKGCYINNCIWYGPEEAIIINKCESVHLSNCEFLLPNSPREDSFKVVELRDSKRCVLDNNSWTTELAIPTLFLKVDENGEEAWCQTWFEEDVPAPSPDIARMLVLYSCSDIKSPNNQIWGHKGAYPVLIQDCDRIDMPHLSIRSRNETNLHGLRIINSSDICLDYLDCTHDGSKPSLYHSSVRDSEVHTRFNSVDSVRDRSATFKVDSHNFRIGQIIRSQCTSPGIGWKENDDFSFGRVIATTHDSVTVYYHGSGQTDTSASGNLVDNVGISMRYSRVSRVDTSNPSSAGMNENPPAIEFKGVTVVKISNHEYHATFFILNPHHGFKVSDRVSSREMSDGVNWQNAAGHDFEYGLVVAVSVTTVTVFYKDEIVIEDADARGVLIPNRIGVASGPV